jgi:hypothetical protein
MKFKGDIIITDPCYIDTPEDTLWRGDKNFDIFTGNGLSKFGFTNYIWEDTIYGDWSCTTFKLKPDSANKRTTDLTKFDVDGKIGSFCADAGLVGVFLLDEVLKFNPKFDYHTERKHTTTLIKDFDGDIIYEVNGDEAQIRGTGNINFVTRQTGL